jgi:RNA polymerase sigma-B factor
MNRTIGKGIRSSSASESKSDARNRLKPDAIDRNLIARYQKSKDRKIQELIVRRHERLVWSIAWRYRNSGEPVEDLVQEGLIGLLRAMDRYDCGSPAKFSSYAAMKVTGNIEHYLRDRAGVIRQPGWVQELASRIHRESSRLSFLLGRQPTQAEIAEGLQLSEDRVAQIMIASDNHRVASLDDPIAGRSSDDLSLAEVISDPHVSVVTQRLESRVDLERAMEGLDELQKTAVNLCFFQDMTFEEAGCRLGVDRHRARRIVVGAVRYLREQLQAA